MYCLKTILYSVVICACFAGLVGCGSAGPERAPPSVQAADPIATGSEDESSAENSGTDRTAIDAAAPTDAMQVAPPTAEQIARWTPAPFEPIELLAIREWEKTSFTSCLAVTPDGKHFIVAGSRVVLWSVTGEEPEHVFLELTAAGCSQGSNRTLRDRKSRTNGTIASGLFAIGGAHLPWVEHATTPERWFLWAAIARHGS